MLTQDLEYFDAAGARYVGFLARPENPSGAAVLVAHNAPGVSDFERGVAKRLAGLGYIVLCADYIGDGVVLDVSQMRGKLGPYFADNALIRGPLQAALAALVAQPGVVASRVAAIGYCFGGTAVLELARDGAELAAVAPIHAGLPLARPQDNKHIKGKVLFMQGAADPLVPPEMRIEHERQLNEAGVDWQLLLFGGTQHAFTVPGAENLGMPGLAYNAVADKRSWQALLNLFAESIG